MWMCKMLGTKIRSYKQAKVKKELWNHNRIIDQSLKTKTRDKKLPMEMVHMHLIFQIFNQVQALDLIKKWERTFFKV
jgi:hypothetical protein